MNILFYGVLDTISLAMFEDLADALREKHVVKFEFGDVIGKKQEAEKIVRSKGYKIGMPKPDIMFISDFRIYPRDRNCIIIDLEHGLGSKDDYYYDTTPYDADYLYCSSRWLERKFRRQKTKFIATGWPKLDKVEKNTSGVKTVLIAPTYNDEYNCLNIIKGSLRDLAKKYRVILKPHQHDKTDWGSYGVEVSYDYNIANLFSVCDVVVSDVSSAYLEFMGLNRPVVVCETDFMRQRKLERPNAHEYLFQNGASYIIKDGSELVKAVDIAFDDTFNVRRYLNSRKLLSYKGRAIDRICAELDKLSIN